MSCSFWIGRGRGGMCLIVLWGRVGRSGIDVGLEKAGNWVDAQETAGAGPLANGPAAPAAAHSAPCPTTPLNLPVNLMHVTV